jgi:hypothetical protein
MKAELPLRTDDFYLVNGGLMYRLLRGAGLIKPDSTCLTRRIIFFSLVTWLPLLILTVLEGLAWEGKVRIPFILDFVPHTRSLVAVPLLIVAEIVVDSRLRA